MAEYEFPDSFSFLEDIVDVSSLLFGPGCFCAEVWCLLFLFPLKVNSSYCVASQKARITSPSLQDSKRDSFCIFKHNSFTQVWLCVGGSWPTLLLSVLGIFFNYMLKYSFCCFLLGYFFGIPIKHVNQILWFVSHLHLYSCHLLLILCLYCFYFAFPTSSLCVLPVVWLLVGSLVPFLTYFFIYVTFFSCFLSWILLSPSVVCSSLPWVYLGFHIWGALIFFSN